MYKSNRAEIIFFWNSAAPLTVAP